MHSIRTITNWDSKDMFSEVFSQEKEIEYFIITVDNAYCIAVNGPYWAYSEP